MSSSSMSLSPGGFPAKTTYGIHITILVLNLIVIGSLIWDVAPGTQSILFFYSAHNTGVVSLAATCIATIWTAVLISRTRSKAAELGRAAAELSSQQQQQQRQSSYYPHSSYYYSSSHNTASSKKKMPSPWAVPPGVRIGMGVFTGLLYLAGSITLGFFMRRDFLWDVSYGNCNARDWTRQQCRQFWYALIAVQLVALFFGIFSLILTITDIALTVNYKTKTEKMEKDSQSGGYFAY